MSSEKAFSSVFRKGMLIQSTNRKNAAKIEIIRADDRRKEIVYRSKHRNDGEHHLPYKVLRKLLLSRNLESLNPKLRQGSMLRVHEREGLPKHSTMTYRFALVETYLKETGRSLPQSQAHREGKQRIHIGLVRGERSEAARQECIKLFGICCSVCECDFEEMYGSVGKGFIHVHHHLQKHSSRKEEHEIIPKRDLRPICPNCHAMIHRREEMLSITSLRKMVRKARSRSLLLGSKPDCRRQLGLK